MKKTVSLLLMLFLVSLRIEAEFYEFGKDYPNNYLIYFIPQFERAYSQQKEWNELNFDIFEFPRKIKHALKQGRKILIFLPNNYSGYSPVHKLAPYIEGSRIALAWASTYASLREKYKENIKIFSYNYLDPINTNIIANFITQKQDLFLNRSANALLKIEPFVMPAYLDNKIDLKRLKNKIKRSIKNDIKEVTFITRQDFKLINSETVVITGGAGFIGSHLAKELIRQNYKVIILDNLSTGSLQNLDTIENSEKLLFFNHDVSIPFNIDCDISYIVHLASLPSPQYYYNKPLETMSVGLDGTKNCLDLALNKKARFLFSSSSEVYGDPELNLQAEDYAGNVNPIGMRSQYDESKRGAETIIKLYCDNFDIDARIIRLFNTYGPYMNINDGRVITNFIRAALEDKPLKLYGGGLQTRSFSYITDTLDGILRVLLSDKLNNLKLEQKIFNVGNDQEFSIIELGNKITNLSQKYLNKTPIITVQENIDKDDPKQRRPDLSRLKNLLGYNYTVSLDMGLEKTFLYFFDIKTGRASFM